MQILLPKQLLRSLLQRLHDWTGSLMTRLAAPTPSAPAQLDSNLQSDRPPAHWLERVRQDAPELLQPGQPVRVRPADAMQAIETIDRLEDSDQTWNAQNREIQTSEAQTSALRQGGFAPADRPPRADAVITTNSGSLVRLHTISTSSSNPQVSYLSEPPSSESVVHPELGSDVVPEQGTERSATPPAEEFTFQRASVHPAAKKDSVHSAANTTADRALRPPLHLKPLPLKLTTFSDLATAVPSAASPDLEQAAVMSNQPGEPRRSSVASGSQSGGQSAQSDRLRQSSAPSRISQSPSPGTEHRSLKFTPGMPGEAWSNSLKQHRSPGGNIEVDTKLESSVDAFTQRGGELDRSAFSADSISQTPPVNLPEAGTVNFPSENSINMAYPRWIDLPDRQNWNGSEDKTWNFILGDRDHLQRLLREQQGDEQAQG